MTAAGFVLFITVLALVNFDWFRSYRMKLLGGLLLVISGALVTAGITVWLWRVMP